MTDNWQNRGGQTQATPQLAPMDLNKEHIFELMSVDFQDGVTETYKGESKIVNKIKMIWKEADKTEGFHRVWINFNEFYSEKSNLMKFLIAASGKPFVSGIAVKLGDYLTEHHRISVMLQAKFGQDGKPNGYYKFIPTSIKPAGVQPIGITHGTALQNAILICTGAQNATDAAIRLAQAKASPEMTTAFEAAVRAGTVKFPIY